MNNTTDDPSDPWNNPAFNIGMIFAMVTFGILLTILIVWLLEKRYGAGFTFERGRFGIPKIKPGTRTESVTSTISASTGYTTGSTTGSFTSEV